MFERYTDRARRAVVLAQQEAERLGHDYIGPEHILLGLIHEGDGVAGQALQGLGITLETARRTVADVVGRGQAAPSPKLPFTPQAKEGLKLALREAVHLGHSYIGTEHLLLGLIRAGGEPTGPVLAGLGTDPDRVRQRVIALLHGHQVTPGAALADRLPGAGGRGKRRLLRQILTRLDAMDSRLVLLEQRVGTGPELRETDQEIAQVRRDKESAIDAQDFENAAVLRDREKELTEERAMRAREWAATHLDLPSLSAEVERLRELLRQHGIEPRDGAA